MTQVIEARPAQGVVTGIIDGDGHFFEQDRLLYPYLADKYKPYQLLHYYLFPDLDGQRRLGRGAEWGPDDGVGWVRFMDHAGIAAAVLFPTAALGFAFSKEPEWAADLAKAYNSFVSDNYLKFSPRLKAVALLPVQDPPAAARELRRAVEELGMVGGILPTPGLPRAYGEAAFDPLFAEAERLGVMLAVHGASRRGLGFDNLLQDPRPLFILGHPFTQMTQFVSMLYGGVWDRFPNLKVAFLEASCGWVPFLAERIDQRTASKGRRLASETLQNSPIYFQAELADGKVLHSAIEYTGAERLIYASDFPHEGVDDIMEALADFQAREDLSLAIKERILRDNIKALYGLPD